MRNLQTYRLFEAKKDTDTLTPEQVRWLNRCTSGTWKVNPQTGLVDVKGDFDCSRKDLSNLMGVRFGVVGGDFKCYLNILTSLEGAPRKVGGGFYCANNTLTSLAGAPQEVRGDFDFESNELNSLEGAPQEVGGYFDCADNTLTSLEGAPQKVGGDFKCYLNNLTSLEGAPQKVGGGFSCDEFQTKEWNLKGWLKILKKGGEAAALILTILPEAEVDKWMREHPLDLDLLDEHPEIKAGVLARTSIRDTSAIARQMRKGIV